MKAFLIFLMASGVLFYSCKPESATTLQSGEITGPDFRACHCCRGWYLRTLDTTYLFVRLPEGSDVDLQAAMFPIPVKFESVPDTGVCAGFDNRIILTHIEVMQ